MTILQHRRLASTKIQPIRYATFRPPPHPRFLAAHCTRVSSESTPSFHSFLHRPRARLSRACESPSESILGGIAVHKCVAPGRRYPPRTTCKAAPTTTATTRQVVQSVAAPTPPPPAPPVKKATNPLVWSVPVAILASWLVWRLTKRKGSVDQLADRGVGLEKDRNVDADKFYKGMMKNVRTTEMPELTKEEIETARARRRQEQVSRGEEGNAEQMLAELELPSNHPWAVAEEEDEETQAKRQANVAAQANRRRMRTDSDL